MRLRTYIFNKICDYIGLFLDYITDKIQKYKEHKKN